MDSEDLLKTRYDETPYHDQVFEDLDLSRLLGLAKLFQLGPRDPKANDLRVLDLGCASGRHIRQQAARYPHVQFTGVDFSRAEIESGQKAIAEDGTTNVELILADPVGSILADYINKGELTEKSEGWLVEGIGEDYIPTIADFERVSKAYSITDAESFKTARELLKKEGLLAGSSTGTLVSAALKYCREQTEAKRVVSFACDTGNKYLSKLYNDFWLEDQGFIIREQCGDLRDLIGRPHGERATITVGPTDVLTTAHNRLRNAGISQLPVMEEGKLAGVLTEDAIMRFVFGKPDLMNAPVSKAMQTAYIQVEKDSDLNNLVAMLHVQPYAAVVDGNNFLGLITRSDVLNHLRRQM